MPPRRVLVLGATSAVAAEVARLLAARGERLHLVGRDPHKLAALVASLPADRTTSEQADLSRLGDNASVVARALATLGGLDLALLAHGDLGDQLASERDLAEAERLVHVNFTSAISLVIPLANHLEQARSGHLAVIGSVAGDRGRPRNYTYGAAKGALALYLQGVRSRLVRAGVSVTTVKLGPVDTPMTATHPKTALFATAPEAARGLLCAIDRKASEAYVPGYWRWIMLAVRHTPEWLFQRLAFLSGR
jgi:decaprenylphospho-beta-D-erythro-pentofuranosid-2-ulose 2-reductase